MNNAMLHIGLGFVAAGAGVLFGRTLTPCAPCFPSTVDLGEVRLFEPTRVAIPLTNPSQSSALNVNSISTSCGCAMLVGDGSLVVPPGLARTIAVQVDAKPPQQEIDFIITLSLDGEAHAIRVTGKAAAPFSGYPIRADAAQGPLGAVVPVQPGAGSFIDRVEVVLAGSDRRLPCDWNAVESRIVLPPETLVYGGSMILWSKGIDSPVWSGPVMITGAADPSKKGVLQ